MLFNAFQGKLSLSGPRILVLRSFFLARRMLRSRGRWPGADAEAEEAAEAQASVELLQEEVREDGGSGAPKGF